jgi:hypothetical protein
LKETIMKNRGPGKLGSDEGNEQGPRPGEGSSSVGGMVAGGSDVEGAPDELLDYRGRAASDKPLESAPEDVNPPEG